MEREMKGGVNIFARPFRGYLCFARFSSTFFSHSPIVKVPLSHIMAYGRHLIHVVVFVAVVATACHFIIVDVAVVVVVVVAVVQTARTHIGNLYLY